MANEQVVEEVKEEGLTLEKYGLTGKNPIAEGNFQWIFAHNCEGTEQLRIKNIRRYRRWQKSR